MKLQRPLLAALLLFAWLFAGAHMALEHGGDPAGVHDTCMHCHDEVPCAPEEHHHHDLGAVAAGKAITAQKMPLAVRMLTPLYDQLLAPFTALLRRAEASQTTTTLGDSPPDERASGWLLVSHTAHPVRGPSLAA